MQAHNTIALTHYWGIKWIDKLRLNLFGLAVFLFVIVFALCFAAESLINKNNSLGGGPPSELKYLFGSLVSIFVTVWVALVRGAQADFEEIEQSRLLSSVPMQGLIQEDSTKRKLELIIGAIFGCTMYVLGRASSEPEGLKGATTAFMDDLSYWFVVPFSLLGFVSMTIVGICSVRITTFLHRQTRLFLSMARSLEIDLLGTDLLAVFANQPIRTLTGTIIFVSSMLVLGDLDNALSNSYYTVGIPLQIVMLITTIIVSPPLWHLRKRVRSAKRRELKKIRQAINGEKNALLGSRIEGHARHFKLPDLLYYQDRIGAVWEWPFHAHVRRMAFYLILPPAAWLMSALVEIMVDNFLVSPPI